ncbi:Six-hairpin glycosidase superfamily [Sesbania bispinosa]|nr:Six-hairpin glycosidase superfamily [Sesbania bispinosa]
MSESTSPQDELLWAAAWLHQATGDEYYLKYVVDNAVYMGGTGWAMKEFSWDNKYAGVQILLSKCAIKCNTKGQFAEQIVSLHSTASILINPLKDSDLKSNIYYLSTKKDAINGPNHFSGIILEGKAGSYASILKQYQGKGDYFACACLQKNDGYNVQKTPGGLVYVHDWNNMQYASSAAFLLAVYSNFLYAAKANLNCPEEQIQPQELLNFTKSQADYILGKNPKDMSYLVGYGSNYPLHVHHRGASIASFLVLHCEVGCVQGFEAWYRRLEPNPNVIYGGLVGGPDKNDGFSDERSNYEQTEPTISGSAPLVGIFAKLQSLYGNRGSYHYQNESPVPQPKTPSTNPHKAPAHTTSAGSLWGLTPTKEKNTYELPQWVKVLKPGSECTFVYVQGGPQAKITIQSFH